MRDLRPSLVSLVSKAKTINPKKFVTKRNAPFLAIGLVLVLGVAFWTFRSTTQHNRLAEQERQAKIAAAQSIAADQAEAKAKQAATKNQDQGTATTPAAAGASGTPSASSAKPKYSTSSDPRSTAYSSTPPAANPASFETKITRNGQLAPGTMYFYNATKGEKGYYGGDLVVSPLSVTLSKSGVTRANVTITVPDGATVGMPHSPWDDTSPYAYIGANSSLPSGSSFNMLVEMGYQAPVGTYKLHITTTRSAQTTDSWRYDAFITVNIVP